MMLFVVNSAYDFGRQCELNVSVLISSQQTCNKKMGFRKSGGYLKMHLTFSTGYHIIKSYGWQWDDERMLRNCTVLCRFFKLDFLVQVGCVGACSV